MSLRDDIKSLIVKSAWNYVELSKELTKITGRKYTNQLLSNRIRKEIISFKEVQIICDVIGYEVEFKKRI